MITGSCEEDSGTVTRGAALRISCKLRSGELDLGPGLVELSPPELTSGLLNASLAVPSRTFPTLPAEGPDQLPSRWKLELVPGL